MMKSSFLRREELSWRDVVPNQAKGEQEMITEQELNKGMLNLKIIWFAMLAALAIYLFVAHQVEKTVHVPMDKDTFAMMKTVLYVVAFITLIGAGYMRKLFMSGKVQHRPLTQTSQHPAVQKYTTATILALAMSESIGIYGLILFLIGKNTMDLYLLILISAAAIFIYRPKKDEVIKLAQEGRGTHPPMEQ
jgi:F0F1-type ATP synthase membrane subunit c/vacuolar-type H+-ATPase subunit K